MWINFKKLHENEKSKNFDTKNFKKFKKIENYKNFQT